MKKTNLVLLFIAFLSLVGLGAVLVFAGNGGEPKEGEGGSGLKDYQENYVEDAGRNREIAVSVIECVVEEADAEEIYTTAFQDRVREALDQRIADGSYNEDHMLVAYNPFRTNSQSLYVYFETQEPCAVSYSVHVSGSETEDFGGNIVSAREGTSTRHEFQITGLMPEEINMITIRMTDESGLVRVRRFYYDNVNTAAAKELSLTVTRATRKVTAEDGTVSIVPESEEELSDGFFVTFPKENVLAPYLRIYDGNGVQRAELPLLEYGTRRLLKQGDRIYYCVSGKKLVALNCLGQLAAVYTADGYTFGQDYTFDGNGDLLVLASKDRQNSVDDCLLRISVEDGMVTELFDLGELLPEYKALFRPKNGTLDWIGLTSVEWLGDNMALLTSAKTGTVIKVRRLYNSPRIVYLTGKVDGWETTSYLGLFLREDNEFEAPGGILMAGVLEYEKVWEYEHYRYRHYLYLLDTNPGAEYGKKEEPISYYCEYLIDENEEGIRLFRRTALPGVTEEGSIQWYQEHLVMASDAKAEFYEYDGELRRIKTFAYEEPVRKLTVEEQDELEDNPPPNEEVRFLRVMKEDFLGYFFSETPVIVLPEEE